MHNLHCFLASKKIVSARSVTDSTDGSLPSQIILSKRGLLTPSTRTGTRDCDSHTTIRPRELPGCFQSRRSSQDRLYKELHPVSWCIGRVLVPCPPPPHLVLPPPLSSLVGGGPRVVVSTAAFHARVRGSVPGLGGLKETKLFLPHPRVKVSIVGSLRDREVACSASDRQGSNFESCVWRTVSSQSSHHPQEVLLAQFSLYVHKGGLKPDSFHFISFCQALYDPEQRNRGYRREVLHVGHNHGMTAILRRKSRSMGEVFIVLLLKIQHFFRSVLSAVLDFFMDSINNQGHPITTYRYGIGTKSHFPSLCSASCLVYPGTDNI